MSTGKAAARIGGVSRKRVLVHRPLHSAALWRGKGTAQKNRFGMCTCVGGPVHERTADEMPEVRGQVRAFHRTWHRLTILTLLTRWEASQLQSAIHQARPILKH